MENQIGIPPPPPPGIQPVRGPRALKWAFALPLAVLLVIAAYWIPIPIFLIYLPGPVSNVDQLIEIDQVETYSSEGKLLLTTVTIEENVTVWGWVEALFDPDKAVVMRQEVTGGLSFEELSKQQEEQMRLSQLRAQEVALAALGIAHPEGRGVRVDATIEGAPADGELMPGDIILSIDGRKTATTCDVGRAIDAAEVGDRVEIKVRRESDIEELSVLAIRNPQDPETPFIGVRMTNIGYKFEPGFEVEFDTENIGGPSAGLMLSLSLYDRLTADDLTQGREIAGTGTITCDGSIGPIGGIEQKVAAAEESGADVFLAPTANSEDARSAADDIEVVSVSNFDDALEYLQALE